MASFVAWYCDIFIISILHPLLLLIDHHNHLMGGFSCFSEPSHGWFSHAFQNHLMGGFLMFSKTIFVIWIFSVDDANGFIFMVHIHPALFA
jgi:hypothetical protein